MINRLKVATIVGTRPEVIRLSRVVTALREVCDHTLIHTGQNFDYELNEIFFDDLDIAPPDIQLKTARSTSVQTISSVLSETERCLREISPEAVLVLGDTNSGLSVLAARKLGIPTFHMEAGNRCFDPRVPEEVNRRVIDHVADINLPYSEIAREYLIREGIPAHRIIVTGSPMREVLNYYRPKIDSSRIVEKLGLTPQHFYVASLHREENVDNLTAMHEFLGVFNQLASVHGLPIVVSTHPRTRMRLKELELEIHKNILFMNPMSFSDYVNLQLQSRAVLSDSGTISEEAAILNLRALNLRESHERPEAMEEAAVIMVGSNGDRVFQALQLLTDDVATRYVSEIPHDYQSSNVSQKICRIIHSYVDSASTRSTNWH